MNQSIIREEGLTEISSLFLLRKEKKYVLNMDSVESRTGSPGNWVYGISISGSQDP